MLWSAGRAASRFPRARAALPRLAGAALALLGATAGARAAERPLRIGVNGHDNWTTGAYLRHPAETTFPLLARNGITTYRVDITADARGRETLARLVALGRRHGIAIRPMLYVDDVTSEDVYRLVKAFAADIDLWELGNELNLRGAETFAESIRRMGVARRGVERAAAETGRPIRTAINVTAFAGASGKGLDVGKTTYPFLDRAVAAGLPFDVITYHYYPAATDRATGWIRTYLEPLRRYGKPVRVTETNCGGIYRGDDGDSAACAATVTDFLEVVRSDYADLISEVILYELFDDAAREPGAEQRFGLLFDLDRPKRTFAVARRFARPAPDPAAAPRAGTP
ncbi:hypothetical protein Q8W71_21355 [Methylobacterium sp. NEAU 140]|uniref:hypothetical protein n=1 Tax=Methylobacterium sp. NEAU 140 TaxID=3064945 RepID=UPI002735CE73|nr:hypothetical protein [Methylobacterium sp. NEAU 140]MDP4025183.1 hypothetical protein [Methylobacterium sp. NEAU 140]